MRALAIILTLITLPLAIWLVREQLAAEGLFAVTGGAVLIAVVWFAGVAAWMPVPLRELGVGALLTRSLLGALLFFLLSSLLVLFMGSEPLWPTLLVSGLSASFVLGAAAVLWYLPIKRVWVLRAALADETTRKRVADELVADFERADPAAGRIGKTRQILRAASAARLLADVKLWRHALSIIDRLDLDGVAPIYRVTAQSWRAVLQLYVGDRAAAFASLSDAFAHTDSPTMLRNLRITMALSTALEGRGRDALAQLAEVEEPREPRLLRSYRLAECEAHAADGNRDKAEQILRDLGEHGDDVRARLTILGGAAAGLAAGELG